MPPKKDAKGQNDKPDNTGIPKNDVAFKFSFSVQTGDQPPECVILYQWMTGGQKYQRYDAGLIQSWQRKQKTLIFQKQHESLRIDDDFCKSLSSHKFYVYFVNPQTSQVDDQLSLDYSSLLWGKSGENISFQFKSQTIKVNNIDAFTIKLQADKQLMQDMYRQYLNPMMVQVIGALDPPHDNSSKYLPSYVKYQFFDNTIVQTQSIYGQEKLIWQHKHVFLAGLMNAQQLKQKIRSSYLRFEFHDQDEIKDNKLKEDIELVDIAKAIAQQLEKDNPVEQDPKKKGQAKKQPQKKQAKKQTKKDTKKKDAKITDPILPPPIQTLNSNYGVAVFSLVQFLKPSVRTAKYKSPVIPRVMFEDFESKNIDLNTTARNQMQKVLFSNNYFDHDTTIVVGFSLASDIGGFVEKHAVKTQNQTQSINVDDKLKMKLNNFERVVVFLPYKDKQNIQKVERIFDETNMAAFGLKNKRQLTTYLLKNQEKISTTVDYLTGLQIIDPQGRVYIIEGLKNKSIQKIYETLPKQVFNTQKQKILKNTTILFTNRMYHDFNIQLKKIRLRPSLSQILLDPSIYIKSKVDQKICQNLNKLSELRKICDDLQTVVSMNLWPQADVLVQIQRKYSQSLTYEDLNGEKEEKKQKLNGTQTLKQQQKTIDFLQQQGYKFKTADDFFNMKSLPAEQFNNNQTLNDQNNTTMKKTVHTKTFVRDKPMKQTYNFHLTSMPAQQNQPVYIYASQKNNWYQKQNQQLRERMQKDKNKMYTMSKDYLSLSIDPHIIQIEAKKEMEMSKSKNYSPQKFSSLLVRTKEQRMKIAKNPGPEDIADMIKYPYHEEKKREINMKKSQRDKPPQNGKDDFKKYLRQTEVFSQPQVLQIQKMARVQQQRLLKQQKLKRQEEERKKLLGDSYIKTKKGYCSDKVTNLDKFTNILQGEPVKKGIIDVSKKSKQKRPVQNYEVSLYLKQKINNPAWNPLVRVDDESKNIAGYEFNNYQKPEFLTQTGIYKPLKNN